MPEIDIKETIKKIVVEEIKLLSPSYNTPCKIKEFVKIAEKSIQVSLKFENKSLADPKNFHDFMTFLADESDVLENWENLFENSSEEKKREND